MNNEWWMVYDELAEVMRREDEKALAENRPYPHYGHSDKWWDAHDALSSRLAQEVEKAFADIEYPGDDNLVRTLEYREYQEFAEAFRGKHWNEIPDSVLYWWRHDLHRFTAEAFRFYFPAFLISGLRDTGLRDTRGADLEAIFFYLTPPEEGSTFGEFFSNRVDGFTPEQEEVIRAFVKFYFEFGSAVTLDSDKRAAKFWGVG